MLMKRKSDQGPESAERLALAVLGWIAGDEDRLYPFLNLTGLTPDTGYDVSRSGSSVTVTPGGSTRTDRGGVLVIEG